MTGNLQGVAKMLQDVANNVASQPGAMASPGHAGQASASSQNPMAAAKRPFAPANPMAAKGPATPAAHKNVVNAMQGGAQAGQQATLDALKAGPVIQKAAYIAALHEAIAKAGTTASFNLESQRNELMAKFRNIASVNMQQLMLQQHMQDQNQLLSKVAELTRKMSEASRNIIGNMR